MLFIGFEQRVRETCCNKQSKAQANFYYL